MPVSSSSAVNVYVRVHRNSPYLVCMDLSLSQSEVIDPNYLWIGPNGQNLKSKLHFYQEIKIFICFENLHYQNGPASSICSENVIALYGIQGTLTISVIITTMHKSCKYSAWENMFFPQIQLVEV